MVHEAFLHHEKRLVDKGACISFKGKKYETKAELIGYNVEISYDPAHPEEITVSYPGIEPFHASPLKIDEYCSHEPYVPVSVKQMNPNTKPVPSRMLKAVEKADEKQKKQLDEILSFANFRKGVK